MRPCNLRFSTQGTCDNDNYCMWDAPSQTCVRTCVREERSNFNNHMTF
jgi:hypothetical protein